MILTRLVELYVRLVREGLVEAQGFERKPIAFLLLVDPDGRLVDVLDTREQDGAEKRGRLCVVPQAVKRTVGVAANLLWDNAEYALGLPRDAAAGAAEREKVARRHTAFKAAIAGLPTEALALSEVAAVTRFLAAHDPDGFVASPLAKRIADPTASVSFALAATPDRPVCSSEAVHRALAVHANGDQLTQCLITGKWEAPARLHPSLKGIVGGQPSGVSLVSFNLPAFESYGLTQGANAPVGVTAAFAYTTSLNYLLADLRHRLRLGQLTVVAWASAATPAESLLADIFAEPPRDETEADRSTRAARVQELLAAPRSGTTPPALQHDYFVLGLAPNAARASVAIWEQARLDQIVARIRAWFDDLALAGRPGFLPERLSMAALLRALAPLGEADRLPPRTPAALLYAAIGGGRLPEELLALALGRLRTPAGPAARYALMALLRAVLHRNHALECPMSLDPAAADPAYRWGRLFAVYEKAQEDAQPGIDATVRDRFWSSAAATPALVVGVLSRLNGHHLRKLEPRQRIPHERLIGEIMSGLRDFPVRLTLPEQGRFALGYWHQRTALFTRRADPAPAIATTDAIP